MIKKESIVLGISAVIIVIAVGITFQSQESAKQSKKQLDTLNIAVQQKDKLIIKLTKEMRATQNALTSVKAELDTAKQALNNTTTAKTNAVVQ